MSTPLSPDPVTRSGEDELPAYISNGVIGLRILDCPFLPSPVLVSGLAAVEPIREIEAAAEAPYPLGADVRLNGVWLRSAPQQMTFREQRYDFGTAEVTTTFVFQAGGTTATFEVVSFASKSQPTLALQEVLLTVSAEADVVIRVLIDCADIPGRIARRAVPEHDTPSSSGWDGAISWETNGALGRCGVALATELIGAGSIQRMPVEEATDGTITSDYAFHASPGHRYLLRQVASVVPNAMHSAPDREAIRLVSRATWLGFDRLRADHEQAWLDLWRGRIVITADDDRWQRLADAAFLYLNTSVHPSALASTSIYGLANWRDYHYYYGHLMWDVETFCVPPLVLLQPDAARTMLAFRVDTLRAARENARLNGRIGVQFPWEAGPLNGDETAPGDGKASWFEDHVSLDIAWAFIQLGAAIDDPRWDRGSLWPVLSGVADWIVSRVTPMRQGYSFRETMGVAERENPADEDAYTNMAAHLVLREATAVARQLGIEPPEAWEAVEQGLPLPMNAARTQLVTHNDFRSSEEKGATPGPLAGLFPLGYPLDPAVAQNTIEAYLRRAEQYIGSPMLSALYGVWAAWIGDRERALNLFEVGYAEAIWPRFLQTLEMHPARFPDSPRSGPFFANLGGYLSALLFGLPGIRLTRNDPQTWPVRPVVLPKGWKRIEVDRLWVRGKPARLVAEHGAARAEIEIEPTKRQAKPVSSPAA
jgi:trehalose/maltose hydrolase-like predicted phosphorylase